MGRRRRKRKRRSKWEMGDRESRKFNQRPFLSGEPKDVCPSSSSSSRKESVAFRERKVVDAHINLLILSKYIYIYIYLLGEFSFLHSRNQFCQLAGKKNTYELIFFNVKKGIYLVFAHWTSRESPLNVFFFKIPSFLSPSLSSLSRRAISYTCV